MSGAVSPRRFRRRLTIVCILVAALSGGFLATTSYLLVREYRHRTFADLGTRRAEIAMLTLPSITDATSVAPVLAQLRERAGFETVAVTPTEVASSVEWLTLAAVPESLRFEVNADSPSAHATVQGVEYLVVGRPSEDGRARVYFFFSVADINESIEQFRNILAVGWIITVVVAAVAGASVARRTLRPVRRAAEASRETAMRLLGHVPEGADDEFEQWVGSFNEVVAALEAKIVELSDAAARERRFTSDVAHELRTPLTALVSAAALLEERLDTVPPDARRPAELLIVDVRRLRGLVIELLELARLDFGADEVRLEPSELRVAVDAALQPWHDEQRLRCDVPADLVVLTDRVRFRRILTNLVDNALRHGRGEVNVVACREGDRVRLDVRDAGPGVAADQAARIFERFYKADTARSRHGSGLGLAIARAQADAVGGSLVLTNPGVPGACFTVRLPLVAVEPDDTTPVMREYEPEGT
jgi:two-component system sensor histidine kinase MtrB